MATSTEMAVVNDGIDLAATKAEETPLLSDDPAARKALEDKLSGALSGAFTGQDDEVELEEQSVEPSKATPTENTEVEEEGEPTEEEEEEEEEEGESTEEEEEEESEAAEPKGKAKAKPEGSPTLPAAWLRSATARGWTQDEVDQALQLDPDASMRTFERMHMSRNAEMSALATLGRSVRVGPPQPTPNDTTPLPTETPTLPKSDWVVDEEALIAEHGEVIGRAIAGPLNQALAQVNAVLPDLRAGVEASKQAKQQVLAKLVEGFFTGEEIAKPFGTFYGAEADGISVKQRGNRNDVLEMADAILAGALLQGRDLDKVDALAAAHESVSSEFKEHAVRSRLKKRAKKQSKGRSLKPSRRKGSPDATGRPADRDALTRRTAQRLKALR